MRIDDLLEGEIRRLYALELGLVTTFDRLDGRVSCRKIGVSIIMLTEAANQHLGDLERIAEAEGWLLPSEEHPAVAAWRGEMEATVLNAPPDPTTDALCLALLRRAVHLRIPCYESARLFAFYAERPAIARTMRLALDDEQGSLERLKSAAELGVSLRAALDGGPFSSR